MFEQATLTNGPAGARAWTTFLGLSSQTFTSSGVILAGDTFTTGNRNLQMAKFGINYRFGGM